MLSEKQVKDIADTLKNSGKISTIAEFLCECFKDKFIEIYVGDTYEELSTDQVSISYPAVFCGKVVTAYRECLVINSVFVNRGNHLQLGNLMFISERAIRAINEVDGNGTMEDMLLRSKETLEIGKSFGTSEHRPIVVPKRGR
jgi:hypothetical protein